MSVDTGQSLSARRAEPEGDSPTAPSSAVPKPDLGPVSQQGLDSEGVGFRLVGSRCTVCGQSVFPAAALCWVCGSQQAEVHMLGPGGALYAGTTIFVAPDRPTPYSIGYVDFDGGVRALVHLSGPEAASQGVGRRRLRP